MLSGLTSSKHDTPSQISLRDSLRMLSAPKNIYELSEDAIMAKENEISQMEEDIIMKEESKQMVEDREELEKRIQQEREKAEEIERMKRSSVVKRMLPRPI